MNNNIAFNIQILSKKRLKLWNEYDNSYDASIGDFGEYLTPWNPIIDDLGVQIYNLIEDNYNNLPLELVLEELSKLGHAPSLLYDDNGHWSIATDGYQSIPPDSEPCDIESVFVVKEKDWFNTINEALQNYFENDNE